MPKLPIDYQKSLIYKLCCNNTDIKDIYIGSTTEFTKRKSSHKGRCNNPKDIRHNLKVYQFIRENDGWNNWSMVLVEKYICESKLELKKRERYWIELLKCKLNCRIPSRTPKEWREDNTQKLAIRHKLYRLNNIDKIKENNKVWRENNNYNKVYYEEKKDELLEKAKQRYEEHKDEILEKAKQRYEEHKDEILEKNKVYNQEHKEEIKEQRKQQYEEHKDEILEKAKEKITCECGCEITKVYLTKHRKTDKHLKLLEKLTKSPQILS